MAKKKPKKLSAIGQAPAPEVKPQSSGMLQKLSRPRVLSTFAFGLSGLLAGLATGLNHFPSLGQTAVIPKMMLLAAYLGDPALDYGTGLATGFAGLIMGACLGFSALSDPKDMGLSLLLSLTFAVMTMTFTGNVALMGIAFLLGHTPVIMAYRNLRRA